MSWEVEIEESLEPGGPARQKHTEVNKSPILKVEEKMTSQVITASTQALLHGCIYMYVYIHTQKKSKNSSILEDICKLYTRSEPCLE